MANLPLNYFKFLFKVSLSFEPGLAQLRIYLRNTIGQNYKIVHLTFHSELRSRKTGLHLASSESIFD